MRGLSRECYRARLSVKDRLFCIVKARINRVFLFTSFTRLYGRLFLPFLYFNCQRNRIDPVWYHIILGTLESRRRRDRGCVCALSKFRFLPGKLFNNVRLQNWIEF